MQTTNGELITAILDGSPHLYGEVVRRFDQRVRATIATRISDPATIDDLVQETFYKGFKNLDRLDKSSHLENWLVSIARNCTTDYFRKPQTRKAKQMDLEVFANAKAGADWVWDEVDELVPKHSSILKLRYQLSLTYEEIASQLELPESTVRGRIFEARKSLKQRLKDNGLFP